VPGASVVSLTFGEVLAAPRTGTGAAAASLWDELAAWLPPPPSAVLVLAGTPEPVAAALRGKGYLVVPQETSYPEPPSDHPEPAAAVLIVDRADLEVTRSLLEAGAAAMRGAGTLVAACARRAGPSRAPDDVRLLLDECGFNVIEEQDRRRSGGGDGTDPSADRAPGTVVSLYRARGDRFTIRGYRAGDEAAILPMFVESFGTPRSAEHWRWKFRDDPYGGLRITEVFDEASQLVAHYAGYPVHFVWPLRVGGVIPALQIGDTMTSKAVRATGFGRNSVLARMVDDFYERHCVGRTWFNYGFNTGHIRKLGERYLGYRYISPVTVWQRSLRTGLRLASQEAAARALGYRTRAVEAVGPDWDEFFARVAPRYGLLAQRDACYVAWRYLGCPDRVHRVVEIRRRSRLVGWGVVAARGQAVVLGDVLLDPESSGTAFPVLLRALARLFPGADVVQGWFSPHPDWWVARLRAAGFAPRSEPNALAPGFAFFAPAPTLADFEQSWYYTMGDSDLF